MTDYLDVPVPDRFKLDRKVAVVTGSSSGLGVDIAIGLAAAGADLVLTARRANRLEETAAAVRALGRRALVVPTDVSDREACRTAADAAVAEYGQIDVLVNNAGFGGELVQVEDDTEANFRAQLDVNLGGSYWMSQMCGRAMGAGSSIVNISSVLAVTTARMPAAGYSAAKAGLLGLTRDMAAQWAPRGIRVNAILPGVFPSEATAHYSESYKAKVIAARIPLGRIGDPSDVAAAVVFLAGDSAAYITGVSLPVDGGVLLL